MKCPHCGKAIEPTTGNARTIAIPFEAHELDHILDLIDHLTSADALELSLLRDRMRAGVAASVGGSGGRGPGTGA